MDKYKKGVVQLLCMRSCVGCAAWKIFACAFQLRYLQRNTSKRAYEYNWTAAMEMYRLHFFDPFFPPNADTHLDDDEYGR